MIELWIGLAMFLSLLVTLLIGVPVAFALITIGMGSIVILGGGIDALGLVAPTLWSSVANFTLTAVPLFILMGAIISASGMGSRLYSSLATLMHGVPGGLTVATTLACTIMAAVSGSSVATAGAIGRFSVSEMRRFGYSDETACGAVAAGGTLGILIPPQHSTNCLWHYCPGVYRGIVYSGYYSWTHYGLELYCLPGMDCHPPDEKVRYRDK